jgi:hypothetical protein
MMFCETLIIFAVVMLGGIIFGMAFSKLAFLALLNMSGLPVNASFTFSRRHLLKPSYIFWSCMQSTWS